MDSFSGATIATKSLMLEPAIRVRPPSFAPCITNRQHRRFSDDDRQPRRRGRRLQPLLYPTVTPVYSCPQTPGYRLLATGYFGCGRRPRFVSAGLAAAMGVQLKKLAQATGARGKLRRQIAAIEEAIDKEIG